MGINQSKADGLSSATQWS